MNAMKPRLVLFLLCFSCAFAVCARATVLPDACGKDNIQFKVKVKIPNEGQPSPALAAPQTGKAQIVFIEALDQSGVFLTTPTMRYGVDGEWVGANRGNSLFTVDVTPGVHHVCVNWQSGSEKEAKRVGMGSFTAEAGKVYYFEANIGRQQVSSGGGFVAPAMGPGVTNGGGGFVGGHMHTDMSFSFSQVSEDEGKYRVKALPYSTWKSHVKNTSSE